MSFAQELQTMPAFKSDKDDDERLKTYILQRVPPMNGASTHIVPNPYRTASYQRHTAVSRA